MANGYDIGELVAEVWVDTSNMSKGIEESKSLLQGFESKVIDVAKGINRQTNVMEKAFKTMSNGMELHLDAILELTQEVKNGFRQMGVQMDNSAAQGQKDMQKLSSGFRTVREGIDHCVRETRKLGTELNKTGNSAGGLNKVTTAVQALASKLRGASHDSESLFQKLSRLSLFGYILYQDLQFAGQALGGLFAPGMKFAVQMENAQIGMSAIMVSSFKTAEGANLQFNDAMKISAGVMNNLRAEALRTTATLEELMTTYQAILGPGVEKGMNLKEIQDITVLSVNAVKAMGLRKDQLVQEIRSILTGNITARSSTVATALGITNEDIEDAKTRVGGVAQFLKERFAGFQMMANETENTFLAIWTNMEDGLQQTQEKAFSPFFDKIKGELKQVQSLFFNITRYEKDEFDSSGKKTHSAGDIREAQLNPQTVATFRQMAQIVSNVYDDIKGWFTEFSNNYDKVQNLKNILNTVSQLIKSVYDNFSALSNIMLVVWGTSGGILRLITLIALKLDALPKLLQFIADHIETIAILWATWAVSTNAYNAIMTVIGVVAALQRSMVALGVTSEATFAATAMASLRCLGIIGLVVAGVWALVEALAAARDTANSVRNDVANASGTGQIPGFDQESGTVDTSFSSGDKSDEDRKLGRERENAEYRRTHPDLGGVDPNSLVSKWGSQDDGKGSKAAANEAAREALAQIDEDMNKAVEALKTHIKELEVQYDEGVIAVEDYYNAVVQAYRDINKAEVDALNQKIAVATKNSDIIKLQDSINKKNEELAQKELELAKKRIKDYKQFFTDLAAIHTEYIKASGSVDMSDSMEAVYNKYSKQLLAIQNFTKGYLDVLNSDTSSEENKNRARESLELIQRRTNELKKIVELEMGQTGVEQQQLEIKRGEASLISKVNALQWDYDNGLITELDYKERSYDIDKQKLQELMPYYEKQYAYLKYMHETSGNPKYLEQMEELREQVRGLQHELTPVKEAIQSTFVDGMEGAIQGMLDGTKNFKDGLKDMVKSMQNIFYKQIANRMSNGIAEYLHLGTPTRGKDAFSDPETQKRVDTMVGEMKKSGDKLYEVFQDSATKVKQQVETNLLPQLQLLANKISEVTGVSTSPLSTTPSGTAATAKPKETGTGTTGVVAGATTVTGIGTTTNGNPATNAQEKNTSAVTNNTNKFLESTNKVSLFAASLATVTGNEGLMKFATTLQLVMSLVQSMQAVGMFGGLKKADGGFVSGAGTGTSDSIPARLSNGEYVVRAASVKKYGTSFLDAVNRGHLPQAKYANGGLVAANSIAKSATTIANSNANQQTTSSVVINPVFQSADPAAGQKMFEQQMPYMRARMLEMMRNDPSFRNAVKGAIK